MSFAAKPQKKEAHLRLSEDIVRSRLPGLLGGQIISHETAAETLWMNVREVEIDFATGRISFQADIVAHMPHDGNGSWRGTKKQEGLRSSIGPVSSWDDDDGGALSFDIRYVGKMTFYPPGHKKCVPLEQVVVRPTEPKRRLEDQRPDALDHPAPHEQQ